jgi:hypothetical protein
MAHPLQNRKCVQADRFPILKHLKTRFLPPVNRASNPNFPNSDEGATERMLILMQGLGMNTRMISSFLALMNRPEANQQKTGDRTGILFLVSNSTHWRCRAC